MSFASDVAPLSSLYRTALVTGASAGLGRAFAEMLLRDGVRVWGTARERSRLVPLSGNSAFTPVELDLADSGRLEGLFCEAERQTEDGFDLLINNAGFGVFARFADAEFSTWEAQIAAMLPATARLSHLALRTMLRRNRGCVVNISSLAVDFPLPFMSGYNIAKAGLSAFSESLIFETRGTGVTVIDFRPGDYRTGFNQAMSFSSASGRSQSDIPLVRAWERLEENLQGAPAPSSAAADLRRALARQRSGTFHSGGFFQARLAPFLIRFAPARLRRNLTARYFGVS